MNSMSTVENPVPLKMMSLTHLESIIEELGKWVGQLSVKEILVKEQREKQGEVVPVFNESMTSSKRRESRIRRKLQN
jgi:hypothetical protein